MKRFSSTPLRLAVSLVIVAAAAAWLPEPLRGLITATIGLGAPSWLIGRLAKRYLLLPMEVAIGVGGIATLATWALAMLGLLAVGVTLSRPEVILVLAAMMVTPAALLRSWEPVVTLAPATTDSGAA